jgi:hypothetical protein
VPGPGFPGSRGEDEDRTRGPPDARGVAKRHHTDQSLNPSTVPRALGAVMTASNSYVSAFAPDAGESVNSLNEKPPPEAPVPSSQACCALS